MGLWFRGTLWLCCALGQLPGKPPKQLCLLDQQNPHPKHAKKYLLFVRIKVGEKMAQWVP